MKKVKILIDPGHFNWVLGGIFTEIAQNRPNFFSRPKKIVSLGKFGFFHSVLLVLCLALKRSTILFSSATPLQNFDRLNPFNTNTKLLWFTHFEGELSQKSIKLLNKTQLIFVHSHHLKDELYKLGVTTEILPVVGAINPELFHFISSPGDKIAWIGTTSNRKNPKLLLEFARDNPDLKFQIFGRNWKEHEIYNDLKLLSNVEYRELNSKITSSDLEECSHYLMLSTSEGGPITLLETLAAGLVPICTPVGIVPELLSDLGYEQQILEDGFTFFSIKEKIQTNYSFSQRKAVSDKIKNYSISRLSAVIENAVLGLIKN
jgi:glycosyltransferase involved in cell wall biosynthesis